MTWSSDEVEAILEHMRAGASIQSGCSRAHRTYFFEAGEWGYEDFDEGATHRGQTSEAAIRELIEREPELSRSILRSGPWRRFSAAFVADECELAREHLRAALVYGDPHEHGRILDAVLAWPASAPDEQVLERIREDLRGFTAWHVFMDAVRWERSAAAGSMGLDYTDTLAQMLGTSTASSSRGDAIGWHYLRASFHELREDFDAAVRELELELETLPPEHSNREHIERSLERVRARAR